jgi:hypothetical protein
VNFVTLDHKITGEDLKDKKTGRPIMRPHPLVYRHWRATEDRLMASRENGTSKKHELWNLEAFRLKLTANLHQSRKEDHRLASVTSGSHR